jgi:hypothetical protein
MNVSYILVPLAIAAGCAFYLVEQRRSDAAITQLSSDVAHLLKTQARTAEDARHHNAAAPAPTHEAAPMDPVDDEEAPTTERPATIEAATAPERALPVESAVLRERMDQRFADERTDPSWAVDARQRAQSRLAAVLPATSEVRSIECRATMCRIESVHADLGEYQQFVREGFVNADTQVWNGGFLALRKEPSVDGKLATVVYVARDGEAIQAAELMR